MSEILDLFKTHEISATWACVGMLFHRNWEEWDASRPKTIPNYRDGSLCPYRFAEQNRDLNLDCYFAPDSIRMISDTPRQELATHTYSHLYCREPGQELAQFEADLEMAVYQSRQFGSKIESLVFPRNQFRPEYLSVCLKHGIQSVRTNPDIWYWRKLNSKRISRALRGLDCYLPLKPKTIPLEKIQEIDGVLLQPASRFLRPHRTGVDGKWFNRLRTNRIKNEITHAAITDQVYHLWWHPHNFSNDVNASLQNLEDICQHFKITNDKYGMASHSMRSFRKNWDACQATLPNVEH